MEIGKYKNTKTLFGKAIKLKQKILQYGFHAQYSHVEVVFDKEDLINIDLDVIPFIQGEEGEGKRLCFSSSETDGGARFKWIDITPENWDLVKIDVSKEDIKDAFYYCFLLEGRSYNYFGIVLTQMLRQNFKTQKSLFCSEAIILILQYIHYSDEICQHSAQFIHPALCSKLIDDEKKKREYRLPKGKESKEKERKI